MRFTLIALLATMAVASANRALIQGDNALGDELMVQKVIDKESKVLRIIEHTETLLAKPNYKITRVEVVEIKGAEKSATPKIISGGKGDTFVTIKFTSERGHGIHYIIKVYGKGRSFFDKYL